MGMLMHHTWLDQQKKAEKPVEKPVSEKVAEETKHPEAEVKKTGGRRKVVAK